MSEWTSKKLRKVVGQPISGSRPKGGVSSETEGIPSLGGENILSSGGVTYANLNRVSRAFYRSMPKGRLQPLDVLINKDGAQTGKVGLYRGEFDEACVNEHLFILRNGDGTVDQRFLYYAVLLPETQAKIQRRITGSAQPGLNTQFVDAVEIAFPILPEKQRRIAEILGTVDEAIVQTEALIAKQQMMKAGLMHDLFTRGVTPEGELRPTPTAAPHLYKESPLGWIPKEWESTTVGACLIGIEAGKSPECPDTPATGDQWGVLKVGAVHPLGFRAVENKVVLDAALQNPAFLVARGDLLFSRANTSELVGLSCHINTDPRNLMLSDKTLRLLPNTKRIATRFLFWILQTSTARRQIENSATGTSGSMKNIGQSGVRSIACVRPDLDEQGRITARIDSLSAEIAAETAHLAKLRQLKQGLMQDLLTGRVPVA